MSWLPLLALSEEKTLSSSSLSSSTISSPHPLITSSSTIKFVTITPHGPTLGCRQHFKSPPEFCFHHNVFLLRLHRFFNPQWLRLPQLPPCCLSSCSGAIVLQPQLPSVSLVLRARLQRGDYWELNTKYQVSQTVLNSPPNLTAVSAVEKSGCFFSFVFTTDFPHPAPQIDIRGQVVREGEEGRRASVLDLTVIIECYFLCLPSSPCPGKQ